MTLGEVLQLVAEYRREDPNITEIYNDRLMQARTRRYNDISTICVEHDLPRSYTTIKECKALAKAVFAGARIVRTQRLAGTTALDEITNLDPGEAVFSLGGAASVIDRVVVDEITVADHDVAPDISLELLPPDLDQEPTHALPPRSPKPRAAKAISMKFARPKNLKELK
jgi:hypothetical protein